jgi:hypothetical protein
MTIKGHSVRTRKDAFDRGDSEINRKEDEEVVVVFPAVEVFAILVVGEKVSSLAVSICVDDNWFPSVCSDDDNSVVDVFDIDSCCTSLVVMVELAAESAWNEKLCCT